MAEATANNGHIPVRVITRRLGLLPLVMIMFFTVSGGAYGLEDLIGSSGPGMGLILILFNSADMESAHRLDGGGTFHRHAR